MYATTRMTLRIVMLSERTQTQKTTYCMISFTCNSGKGKLLHNDREQISDYLRLGVAEVCTAKGQEETFGNDENVLYLTWDHGFTGVYLHQNSPNYIP